MNKQPRRAGREEEHPKGVPTAPVLSPRFDVERHTFAYESIMSPISIENFSFYTYVYGNMQKYASVIQAYVRLFFRISLCAKIIKSFLQFPWHSPAGFAEGDELKFYRNINILSGFAI